jgi:hypothetical protein
VVAGRIIPATFETRHFAAPRPKIAIGIASVIMWRQLDVLLKGGYRWHERWGQEVFLKVAGSFLAALGLNNLFFLFFPFNYNTKIKLLHNISLI